MYLLKNSILSIDQLHFINASTWILFWMKHVGTKTVVMIKTANWTVKGKDVCSNLDSILSVEWLTSRQCVAVITLCIKSCMSSHGAQWTAQGHCLNWGHQNCVSVLFFCFVRMTWFSWDHCDWPWTFGSWRVGDGPSALSIVQLGNFEARSKPFSGLPVKRRKPFLNVICGLVENHIISFQAEHHDRLIALCTLLQCLKQELQVPVWSLDQSLYTRKEGDRWLVTPDEADHVRLILLAGGRLSFYVSDRRYVK